MNVFECRSRESCTYSTRTQLYCPSKCPPKHPHRPQPVEPFPKPRCTLQGNVIKNGGFELWVGQTAPLNWAGSNVIASSCRHTGISAAQLGKISEHGGCCECGEPTGCLPAVIFQEVPVCPGITLVLNYFLALFVTESMFRDCSLE